MVPLFLKSSQILVCVTEHVEDPGAAGATLTPQAVGDEKFRRAIAKKRDVMFFHVSDVVKKRSST